MFYHRNKQGSILLEVAVPIILEEGTFLPYCNVFFHLGITTQTHQIPFYMVPVHHGVTHCFSSDTELLGKHRAFTLCHLSSPQAPLWGCIILNVSHKVFFNPILKALCTTEGCITLYYHFLLHVLKTGFAPRTQATFSVLQYFSKPVKI